MLLDLSSWEQRLNTLQQKGRPLPHSPTPLALHIYGGGQHQSAATTSDLATHMDTPHFPALSDTHTMSHAQSVTSPVHNVRGGHWLPPHHTHLQIAARALEEMRLRLMPTCFPPALM